MKQTSLNNALKAGIELQDGEFTVVQTLGAGGFAITYKMRSTKPERLVAVKELFLGGCRRVGTEVVPDQDPDRLSEWYESKEAFMQEAKALAQVGTNLKEAWAVIVHQWFEENRTFYMVMEYIEGETLASKSPDPEQAIRYAIKIGEALQSLHQFGIIHRDIKPTNIMVTQEGKLRLIDFGAARDQFSASSTSLLDTATRGFTAPEQRRGEPSGQQPPVDIYSLAATLFYLLTLEEPESDASRRHQQGASIHPAIRRVIEHCMAEDPATRPPNMAEVVRELREAACIAFPSVDFGRSPSARLDDSVDEPTGLADAQHEVEAAEDDHTQPGSMFNDRQHYEIAPPNYDNDPDNGYIPDTMPSREGRYQRQVPVAAVNVGRPASDSSDQIKDTEIAAPYRKGMYEDPGPEHLDAGDIQTSEIEPTHGSELATLLARYNSFQRNARDWNIAPTDATLLLSTRMLAADVLSRLDAQEIFLELVDQNEGWWKAEGRQAFERLCAQAQSGGKRLSEALEGLRLVAVDRAVQAVRQGEQERAIRLLSDIVPVIAPRRMADTWRHVLQALSTSATSEPVNVISTYSLAMRLWLLSRWASVKGLEYSPLVLPWLNIGWEEIDSYLALPIPEDWRSRAIVSAVHSLDPQGRAQQDVVGTLQRHEASFCRALRESVLRADEHITVIVFFKRLTTQRFDGRFDLMYALIGATQDNTGFAEWLLEAAELDTAQVKDLFENHSDVLELIRLRPIFDRLTRRYLNSLALEDLGRPQVEQVLHRLTQALYLAEELRQRADRWRKLVKLLRCPESVLKSTHDNNLVALGNAIQVLKPEDYKLIAETVAPRLAAIVSSEDKLAEILQVFGTALAGSDVELLGQMMRVLAARYADGAPVRTLVVEPYIKWAMEHELTDSTRAALDQLVGTLDRDKTQVITRRSVQWRKPAQDRWRAYLKEKGGQEDTARRLKRLRAFFTRG